MRPSSLLLSILFTAAATLALPSLAAYPDKPIRLIVPSAPGGAPDVLMRTLAQQMSIQMGVPFVIDNKPGASFVIGTMETVKAPPDGYTLAYGNIVSLATNRGLLPNVPYDVDKDLTLIGNSFKLVNMMIVNNDLPVKTVSELIAYAKKNPGKIAYGSGGNGTTDHLGVELFKSMTGTFMLHVPYKATVAALTDLQGGSIQLMMSNTPIAGPAAQAGRVRALAVSGLTRSPSYPDVPTLDESGVKGFESTAWWAVFGPANLPAEVAARLRAEIEKIARSDAFREKLGNIGVQPQAEPVSLADFQKAEVAKWGKAVRDSGAQSD